MYRTVRPLTIYLVCSLTGLLAVACEKDSKSSAKAESSTADKKSDVTKPDPHGMQGKQSPHRPSSKERAQGKTPAPPMAIMWDQPQGWEKVPGNPMRQATYRAPGEAGDAEIAVFYFGPKQGGGVEANIERWVGQFRDLPPDAAKRDQEEISGFHVYTVRVKEGTFAGGMPGASPEPRESWGLHAAIVETPSGRYFFKMTGPATTVSTHEEKFEALLESMRAQ